MADFEAIGIDGAGDWLHGISDRLAHLEGAEDELSDALEQGYRQRWATRWRNRYLIDSGALRASFTDSDSRGAIREAHGATETFEFGSRVPYAEFHSLALGIDPGSMLGIPEVQLERVLADYYVDEQHGHPLAVHR